MLNNEVCIVVLVVRQDRLIFAKIFHHEHMPIWISIQVKVKLSYGFLLNAIAATMVEVIVTTMSKVEQSTYRAGTWAFIPFPPSCLFGSPAHLGLKASRTAAAGLSPLILPTWAYACALASRSHEGLMSVCVRVFLTTLEYFCIFCIQYVHGL